MPDLDHSFPRRVAPVAFLSAIASARAVLSAFDRQPGKLGICSFSCHRQWQQVGKKPSLAKFHDGASFYDYVSTLGVDGVQTSFASLSSQAALSLREKAASMNKYLEGDIRIPQQESELERFEQEVIRTAEVGATVARSFLLSGRRYEIWKSRAEFNEYRRRSSLRLAMIEPILARHQLKLAIENHKDFLADELVELLEEFHSPWLGVTIDTSPMKPSKDWPHTP
jgi:3-oxoisoapionate decarboxylase